MSRLFPCVPPHQGREGTVGLLVPALLGRAMIKASLAAEPMWSTSNPPLSAERAEVPVSPGRSSLPHSKGVCSLKWCLLRNKLGY